MKVISFVNQKGGCGKSTLACHLAWWLAEQGKSVSLVDADAQQSASRWLQSLHAPIPTHVINEGTRLLEEIPQIAQSFDFTVVDGGGMLSDLTLNILLRSDLAVIPTQPTGLDLASTGDALKLAHQVQSVRSGKPKVCMVISRASKGTRLLQESRTLLAAKGTLLKTTIYQRQSVADCFGQQAVIWTMPSDSGMKEAKQEFTALCQEILSEVI
jgi:chromosome partitioning protein